MQNQIITQLKEQYTTKTQFTNIRSIQNKAIFNKLLFMPKAPPRGARYTVVCKMKFSFKIRTISQVVKLLMTF